MFFSLIKGFEIYVLEEPRLVGDIRLYNNEPQIWSLEDLI
jgi:hypothetical protein